MRKGIDYSWGRPSPAAIKAAGYTFVSRYLSRDTTGKNLTKAEAQALIAVGIDVVCNWEYATKEALKGYSEGVRNAQEAQRQAIACGMPADRPIYFSVDFDATPAQQDAINSYFDGVASVIGRDRCGAYGGYHVIKQLFDASKIRWGWQTYAWSGGHWDSRAQVRQVQNGIKVGGADCDANEALAEDFGQWGIGPHSAPCPTLSQGSTGSFVETLQGKLNSLYESASDPRRFPNSPHDFKPPLDVDGSFGPLTHNAVWDYQHSNKLNKVDGIVGPETWGSLGGC